MNNDIIKQNILDYVSVFEDENGYSPTVRELCSALGVKSTSSMHTYLKQLIEDGEIEMSQGRSRTIKILKGLSLLSRPVKNWLCEIREFIDDDGELAIYAVASCSACGKPYHNSKDIYYNRTNFYSNHDESEILPKKVKKEFRDKAKIEIETTKGNLPRFCEHCGAELTSIVVTERN